VYKKRDAQDWWQFGGVLLGNNVSRRADYWHCDYGSENVKTVKTAHITVQTVGVLCGV
jgi:hypothetical protein